jgi:hypothetical protein
MTVLLAATGKRTNGEVHRGPSLPDAPPAARRRTGARAIAHTRLPSTGRRRRRGRPIRDRPGVRTPCAIRPDRRATVPATAPNAATESSRRWRSTCVRGRGPIATRALPAVGLRRRQGRRSASRPNVATTATCRGPASRRGSLRRRPGPRGALRRPTATALCARRARGWRGSVALRPRVVVATADRGVRRLLGFAFLVALDGAAGRLIVARAARRAAAHLLERSRRARRAVGHDQDASRCRGLHPELLAARESRTPRASAASAPNTARPNAAPAAM